MLSLSIIFPFVTVHFSVQLVKCSQMAAGAITEPLQELRTASVLTVQITVKRNCIRHLTHL